MLKKLNRNSVYRYIFYGFLLLLFIISISTPFLSSDSKDLYIYHLFNPTDIPFDGTIYNFYSYPIVIFTILILLVAPLKSTNNDLKRKIYISVFKIIVFFIYLFVIVNYFRVIYPNSFIIGFNTSNLYLGLYTFVLFLTLLLFRIIFDIVSIHRSFGEFRYLFDIHEDTLKVKKRLIKLNRIFVILIIFSFISLFFVPFYINFTEYMKEPGFEHLLDLRTSVDYYFLSLFDSSFSLTIPSIILILLVSILPLLLVIKDENRSIYKLIATMIFYILLVTFGVIFGLVNKGTIKPILELRVNAVAIFFIALSLISALIVLISSSAILIINRNEERKNGEFDSL